MIEASMLVINILDCGVPKPLTLALSSVDAGVTSYSTLRILMEQLELWARHAGVRQPSRNPEET